MKNSRKTEEVRIKKRRPKSIKGMAKNIFFCHTLFNFMNAGALLRLSHALCDNDVYTRSGTVFNHHIPDLHWNQIVQRREMDPERTQLFPPVLPVVSEHEFDVVLINRWIMLTDHADAPAFLIVIADPLPVGKRNLRVGNHIRL